MPSPSQAGATLASDPPTDDSALLAKPEALSANIEEIKQVLGARRAALRIANARATQNDPSWLEQLRAQYTEEVCRRTLEINQTLPLEQG